MFAKPARRDILRALPCGFGMLGLGDALASTDPHIPRAPHFAPKAKRVIFLFMHGGPSHMDTFDPKPRLERDHGKPLPFERPLTFAEGKVSTLLKSPWRFRKHGQSGIEVSELLPNIATCVDDLCVIRSMVGDSVAHGGAIMQLHTGSNTFTRPSMGSWVVFGLGSENRNLPSFITIKPTLGFGGAKNWNSGFLPAVYQGTAVGHGGLDLTNVKDPIEHLSNKRYSPDQQRYQLEMLRKLNAKDAAGASDPELEARIQAFELAFRMQTHAPEAFDVSREAESTRRLYGLDEEESKEFGWQCLVARRLAERGVRFIQCSHTYRVGNEAGWDAHTELVRLHTKTARHVDKPVAGLLKDLKSRGLLDDTLVLWGGEFGRTPIAEGGDGRDHNPYGYTMWLAGGGVKRGMVYGATDEFGYHAVEDRMHLHDLHATILHLLGLDHMRLTWRQGGRDFRLTDVAGVVARKIVA
ncbi:MAG: DUF1501 domain-containing protein [Acidobacteria bacterium]|nr:DUF1501 domain-containing protein [Acidobacteriota bacterium]